MAEKKSGPIIELKGVKKVYQMGEVQVHALKGVDLSINRGEFVAIIGHSGSGKSTLLNMVGSLDLPNAGKIKLNGIDISTLSESELAQMRGRTVGYIFQFFNLMPTLNAMENVMLPLMFQGVSYEERKERAEKILKRLGMGGRMDHHPNELSGGEQQRVAIARALVVEPEVLLADEPTGNLDYHTGLEIIKLLKELHEEEKKTIIIVTHERFIAQQAKRIVQLQDGQVLSDGKSDRVNFNHIKEK